jgi:3-hydroxyisobutyrate dehydrogenase/glyoxylate/succinic semialdehyde reductase
MAANLLGAGYDLVVYNRTRGKAEPLLMRGARWAASPTAAATGADVLFTMLSTPEIVEELALGRDGFLGALKREAVWVDCTTVNPSFSRRMAAAAKERGVRFLDAPVAGTKGPAEQGTLTFLVGGDAKAITRCQPLFDVMGSGTVHAGGHGMGTSLKIVFNLLLGEAMQAFCEGMALGEALGLSRDTLLDTLLGSAVVAPFVAGKREMVRRDAYEAHFPLKWMHKDLHLATLTAYENGVALPAGNAVKETYALAARQGLADNDFAAIYRYLSESKTG